MRSVRSTPRDELTDPGEKEEVMPDGPPVTLKLADGIEPPRVAENVRVLLTGLLDWPETLKL